MKLPIALQALVVTLVGACAEPAEPPTLAPTTPEVSVPADAPLVAFLGDSITAGLHVDEAESFPAVLERRFAEGPTPFRRLQAGVSGDTTAGGLRRVDWLLKQDPAVVVVELGGNDGLRGIPLETVEENLRGILVKVREHGAEAILLGIRLYENYAEYAERFDALYPRLAEQTGARFVPYFMRDVGGVPELNVEDQLHPNPAGHAVLADNLEEALASVLAGLPDDASETAPPDRR